MSDYAERVVGRRNYGRLTQNSGTVITRLVEPWRSALTRITGVFVKTSTTAHILTLLRPCNVTTFSAAAAASQAVVNITADPGAYSAAGTLATANNVIAASDFVVYEAADGTYVLDTVSSVATLAITLTTNLPTGGVLAGGKFWFYGIVTDTNPNNNQAHPRWNLDASTATVLGRADGLTSIPDHPLLNVGGGSYQPLILHVDNGTAASTIESVGVEYVRKAAA
jgi:hypothetical protein